MSRAKSIAHVGRISLGLAEQLAQGIPADRFARYATGRGGEPIVSNHPAFVFGHLSRAGSMICQFVGDEAGASAVAVPGSYQDLFGMGSPCVDDADGTRYPPMEEVLRLFKAGYERAIAAVEAVHDDGVFERINPIERLRGRMPTVGVGATFMLGSHVMFHLGQVSAWRRAMGLGPAVKL